MRAPFRRSAGRLPSSLEAGQVYVRDLVATAGLLVTAGAPTVERRRLDARARPSARLAKIQRWRLCKTTDQSEGVEDRSLGRNASAAMGLAGAAWRRCASAAGTAFAIGNGNSGCNIKGNISANGGASITCLDRSTTTSPKSPKPKAKDGSVQKRRP